MQGSHVGLRRAAGPRALSFFLSSSRAFLLDASGPPPAFSASSMARLMLSTMSWPRLDSSRPSTALVRNLRASPRAHRTL